MPQIEVRYRRPPDRLDIFFQDLVVDEPDHKITLHDPSSLATPLTVRDRVIYEPGAPIVWYVFPSAWFDIGAFHLNDGTLTGHYVNFIAPPDLGDRFWIFYDLCLDIWIDVGGDSVVLDEDEFDEAVDSHWIDAATAERVRNELDGVLHELEAGRFPPPLVGEYPLERIRELARVR